MHPVRRRDAATLLLLFLLHFLAELIVLFRLLAELFLVIRLTELIIFRLLTELVIFVHGFVHGLLLVIVHGGYRLIRGLGWRLLVFRRLAITCGHASHGEQPNQERSEECVSKSVHCGLLAE